MSAKSTDEYDLDYALAELKQLAITFEAKRAIFAQEIESAELKGATEKAYTLFKLFKGIAKRTSLDGLEDFFDDAINITGQLQNIAKNEYKKFAPPNQIMKQLTKSFEAFAQSVASKQTRERIRNAAAFIPVIDGVVASCGGIPYYFEHANRYEKVAMVLSATLLLSALAMTIATFASPAICAVPFLAPAIATCVTLSRVLYDQSVKNAKHRYEEKQSLLAAESGLGKLTKDMNQFKKDEFLNKVETGLSNMAKTEHSMLAFIKETFGVTKTLTSTQGSNKSFTGARVTDKTKKSTAKKVGVSKVRKKRPGRGIQGKIL